MFQVAQSCYYCKAHNRKIDTGSFLSGAELKDGKCKVVTAVVGFNGCPAVTQVM